MFTFLPELESPAESLQTPEHRGAPAGCQCSIKPRTPRQPDSVLSGLTMQWTQEARTSSGKLAYARDQARPQGPHSAEQILRFHSALALGGSVLDFAIP